MSGTDVLNTYLQILFGGMEVHTEGIWSYIKLPNGLAIAWGGEKDATMVYNATRDYCWYAVDRAINMPANLFVGAAKPIGTATANHYCAPMFAVSGNKLYLQMSSSYSFVDLLVTWNAVLIGHWK
ncbi:hypothetical protein OBO34_19650 [Clostridiales Family XIII bacterium ASD5510]|uniref:Uncharacterized protein n=1 Tax=Hominibacterium faecale TaxID=2839743 RepID=A0A9J6QYE4_9FIRM|nr:hypothetical protein [Hominibacterium faecale]MCU7380531.1 hypothetical protein [Hominibacterium faecale]